MTDEGKGQDLVRTCFLCSLMFAAEHVVPVIVRGADIYMGHPIRSEGERSVYLCNKPCLDALMGATIDWMEVQLDEERIKKRGPLPKMALMDDDDLADFWEIGQRCMGVGDCQKDDGSQDPERRVTYWITDNQDRQWAYCHRHALRAYEWSLRRWRANQAQVA